MGSFDNKNRTIDEVDFESTAGFKWIDWVSAVCLLDFLAMIFAILFVLTWNSKSQSITDSNDANNQTPEDYVILVKGLPKNVNFTEQDFVRLFTPHISQDDPNNEILDVNIGRALKSNIFD